MSCLLIKSEYFKPYIEKIAIEVKNSGLLQTNSKTPTTRIAKDVLRVDKTLSGSRNKSDRQPLWVAAGRQPDLERVDVSRGSSSRLSHLEDKRISQRHLKGR